MSKQKNSNKLLKWFHKYRLKIVFLSFIIILPITLITLAYAGTYAATTKVYFDDKKPETLIKRSDFVEFDDITELALTLDFYEVQQPKENDEKVLTGGLYRFKMKYTPKITSEFSSVAATLVLQTPWVSTRSETKTLSLKPTEQTFSITYNHILPKRTHIFITVDRPILYIKLDITRSTNDPVKTYYLRHDLNSYTPFVR